MNAWGIRWAAAGVLCTVLVDASEALAGTGGKRVSGPALRPVEAEATPAGETEEAASARELEALRRAREDDEVKKAIDRGLKFLAKRQREDGSFAGPKLPPGPDGQEPTSQLESTKEGYGMASTAMAVMAFYANGHVPGRGPYGENLERAVRYIKSRAMPNGMVNHTPSVGRRMMYTHGFCSLMLGESYGMTEVDIDEVYRKAVVLILSAQDVPKGVNDAGGWRYTPDTGDSDMSHTGEMVSAMWVAKGCGMDVPQRNVDRAVQYIKNQHSANFGGFGYRGPGKGSFCTAGAGMLSLQLLGHRDSPEVNRTADAIVKEPISWRSAWFYLSIYYTNQAMFQKGGAYWETWWAHARKMLLEHQQADGSWPDAQGHSERNIGPSYRTAFAILALSIPNQYLPSFQR